MEVAKLAKKKDYKFGDRGKQLQDIMETYGLSKVDLVEITGNSHHTVTAWTRSSDNAAYREISMATIKLLQYAVRELHRL